MKRIIIFLVINIIGFFFQLYVLMPHCYPCRPGEPCSICMGKEQGIFLIALLLFDIFYILKYFIKPRIKKNR